MTATMIVFDVLGTPVTQGSAKAFVVGGRARVTHDKRGPLLDWRSDIAHAASQVADGKFADRGVPVTVRAVFRVQRPKSAPKRVVVPTTKPDADKLVRSLLDALTGVLFADDSQVVTLAVDKRFATNGTAPGVHVTVTFGDDSDD